MSFYPLSGSVSLLVLFFGLSDVESMRTLKNVAVQHGGSVTIPCLYEEKYRANPKYWCKGYYWASCSIVAYANSNGSTSVIDHPALNMFTVGLKQVSESETYWCGAEITGAGDDGDYLQLTVSQDLSAMKSRVRGEEGGSITVQCLYSAAYQSAQKQWCRFRDGVCNTARRTETSQNSAVQLSDDGRSSFSVQMSELKKQDAGWYWCSAGDLQVPVHISVGDEAPGLHEKPEVPPLSGTLLALCIVSGLLLLLVVVGLVIWKLKQRRIATKKGNSRSLSPKAHEDAVTYSTVADHLSKASSAPKPEVTYSSVRISHSPNVCSVPSKDNVIYSAVKHP